MCTALTTQTSLGETWFGRTMDFSYPLEPQVYIVTKGYEWTNTLNTHKIKNRYSYIGTGQDVSQILFADGVNEMGFAIAVLYFPGYAEYDQIPSRSMPHQNYPVLAAQELAGFLLGMSPSVRHAASLLGSVRIVGLENSITNSIAPLHWIMADRSGACMVIEKTSDGLNVFDNPIGVLANSPDFPWHLTNLRNYLNVVPQQSPERSWGTVKLSPFGQGSGTFGLPGDYSPPSRFVRAAWMKSHTPVPGDRKLAVETCFHLLDCVSVPKGAVITERGTDDYTQYTAFMDLSTCQYYFKTYSNSRITEVMLPADPEYGPGIVSLGLLDEPAVFARRSLAG